MLERLLEWPACEADQTVPYFDDSVYYPTEDLFQDDLIYATNTDQQALSDSPELVSGSRQSPTSEAQDAISWRYIPYMRDAGQSVRHSTIHRPTPQYPLGYDHGVGYPSPVDGHTPDESTIDATPALTDSQSESFYSPVTEDVFTCVSGSLRHKNISRQTQPPSEPQVSCFSTYFSPGALEEEEFAPKSIQEAQVQIPGYYQPPSIHVTEYPTLATHIVSLKFSRERYNALLLSRGPVPKEIKIPTKRNPYSFVVLDRKGYHPIISITEIGGKLSDITVDLNGTIKILTKENFCRVPGCGYWSKNAGRVPRHRFTHFKDRGFECKNPFRRGTDAPKHLQCQLGPGQYMTRLDLFKNHFRAQSCKGYAPLFTQDSQSSLWHGPDTVDEVYLLPFTRDIHVPFILRTPKS